MKNITKNIIFDAEKAHVFSLKKSDKLNYFAVGLGKSGVLRKHKASVPSTLVVLLGALNFIMENETVNLHQFDVYEIPVDIEHEVIGLAEENLFTVSQEL